MDFFNKNPWLFWVLLFVLPPVGLFFMFRTKKFNKPLQAALTVAFGFLFLVQLSVAFGDTSPSASTPTAASPSSAPAAQAAGSLSVHFIDVGQADSTLVQSPSSVILIDGGNNEDGPKVVAYLKAQGVTELAAIIATHPHEDHIGGLDTVIKAFPPRVVYLPNATTTTQTFNDFISAVSASGAKRVEAKAGTRLDVSGITGTFLAPTGSNYDDLNHYSAVLKITYHNTSFLFTGDAESNSENEMLKNGNLQATVLKVGHHGSDSSTTPAFLKAVSPKYAAISCGKDNSYGHPHDATLNALSDAGIEVFRTDLSGTIVATSDGKTITFDKKASPVKENAPPAPVAKTPSSNKSDVTVYVTDTGHQYHRDGCRHLSKSKIETTLSKAKSSGYGPCSICKPPQ
ncbi:hypothetical protein Sgly_0369 [Syntrophobotulus glycolicus DSM 8271]|uniref:Metallo-beta-lactamase domain-containing protein n=1 Tax=Syntrophobotulus glycolicus (strain DSM 8271 / FlGlyR) TaxID=645991 RepID=F0SXI9_SYNGF|nr:ComEC/Rec2 family competence protein [Syntrophobotulus glycolicus]ADY54735.1 hypothetical protein Sgly_0369 [Syntrophobotulus glycolicus DSM 8271]